MRNQPIDTEPFMRRFHRLPDETCVALWTLLIEDAQVSFWGTFAEISAQVSLYAQIHAIEEACCILMDYSPIPKTIAV